MDAGHLGSGVLGSETPVDGGFGLVGFCFEDSDVYLLGVFTGVPFLVAGPGQNAEINLGQL